MTAHRYYTMSNWQGITELVNPVYSNKRYVCIKSI